jgi:GH18 family chitinase
MVERSPTNIYLVSIFSYYIDFSLTSLRLEEQGAKVKEDMVIVSSYSYDFDSKQLVSYDTPSIVQKKAE